MKFKSIIDENTITYLKIKNKRTELDTPNIDKRKNNI